MSDADTPNGATQRIRTNIDDIVHGAAVNAGMDPETVDVEDVRMVGGELEIKLRGVEVVTDGGVDYEYRVMWSEPSGFRVTDWSDRDEAADLYEEIRSDRPFGMIGFERRESGEASTLQRREKPDEGEWRDITEDKLHVAREGEQLVTDGGVQGSATDTERVPPLNLTEDEAEALWEMVKIGIGDEDIQFSDMRDDAESVHAKVKELVEE